MDNRIERDVRLLKGYAVFSTVAVGVLLLAAFRSTTRSSAQKTRFDETAGDP